MGPSLVNAETVSASASNFSGGDVEMSDPVSRSLTLESSNDSSLHLLGERTISKDASSNQNDTQESVQNEKVLSREEEPMEDDSWTQLSSEYQENVSISRKELGNLSELADKDIATKRTVISDTYQKISNSPMLSGHWDWTIQIRTRSVS